MEQRILKSIFKHEGNWNTVSVLEGDRGGVTQGGISSNAYPHLYEQISNGSLSEEQILTIYRDDYLRKIYGWEWLLEHAPSLLQLLFTAKVHGSGFRHYTSLIQELLNDRKGFDLDIDGIWGPKTFRALSEIIGQGDLILIAQSIDENTKKLQQMRVASVGSSKLSSGIASRVQNEIEEFVYSNLTYSHESVVAGTGNALVNGTDTPLRKVRLPDGFTFYA